MKEQLKIDSMTDGQLVNLARAGNEAAGNELISRYRSVVRAQASSYYMEGADGEDLVQEGMIGFFKAIQNYDAGKGASFSTFASMCVRRQLISAVKSASRFKHEPLNKSLSLSGPLNAEYGSQVTLEETLENLHSENPEKSLLDMEEKDRLKRDMKGLFSEMERSVLKLRLEGMSYNEIASELGCTSKSVDNAVRRVKNKLSKYL